MTIEKILNKLKEEFTAEEIATLKNYVDTNPSFLSDKLTVEVVDVRQSFLEQVERYIHYLSSPQHSHNYRSDVQLVEHDNPLLFLEPPVDKLSISEMQDTLAKIIELDDYWGELVAYGLIYHLDSSMKIPQFDQLLYTNADLIALCQKFNPYFYAEQRHDSETNLNHTRRLVAEILAATTVTNKKKHTHTKEANYTVLSNKLLELPVEEIQSALVKIQYASVYGNKICMKLLRSLKPKLDPENFNFIVNDMRLEKLY